MPEEYFKALCRFCEYSGALKSYNNALEELKAHVLQYHPLQSGDVFPTQCAFPILDDKPAKDFLETLKKKRRV